MKDHAAQLASSMRVRAAPTHSASLLLGRAPAVATGGATGNFPELVSRLRRFRSARISAALWQRTSRSFSSALLMIRSSSGGTSGLIRLGRAGVLFRIESKIAADVS